MHVTVRFGAALRAYADGANHIDIELPEGADVGDVLDMLAARHPAAERRIRDETGLLRPHVNVFVDGDPVARRSGVTVVLHDDAELLILPAVSGGAA